MVGENVTGRGKIRAVGVAAHLAIKVGAWGFHKLASDSKANLDLAREKFFQAQKNARKRKQTALKFGKGWTLYDWEGFANDKFDSIKRANEQEIKNGARTARIRDTLQPWKRMP